MTCLLLAGVANADGIYGTILYGPDGVVESPTVNIQKWNGISWTLVGTSPANVCGYYTYSITSGWGTYRICVYGTYDLRYGDINSCSSEFQTNEQIGACTGNIYFVGGWQRTDMCATGGSSC